MELQDARLTIVGLGLMGGSMALRLQERCRALCGVDTDPGTAELAAGAGVQVRDLSSALSASDALVLATPVKETLRLLENFRADPPRVRLLLDLGSSKRLIVEAMESLPEQIGAIGGHPLCGKERGGFAAAEAGLFEGSLFVLTPCTRTTPEALSLAEQLVHQLGASARQMQPAQHDRFLAAASHLPYLLGAALMGAAETFGQSDPSFWELAATGFMSTSRLAASELTMMVDVLTTNQDMVLQALARAQAELGQLRRLLSDGKEGPLREFLAPLQQRRAGLAPRGGTTHGA